LIGCSLYSVVEAARFGPLRAPLVGGESGVIGAHITFEQARSKSLFRILSDELQKLGLNPTHSSNKVSDALT
jgi:hypothetical protein